MSLRSIYILIFILHTYFIKAQGFNVVIKQYQPDCSINSVKINVSGNKPPYTFTWGNGMTGDSISNLKGGVYAVHITDSLGKDTTFAFILPPPACAVVLSNHFTPNGDGINDTWSVANTDKYPNFLLQIFDRWGQLVHSQRHQYIPWEGTQLGLKLPDATYYYIFFYDGGDAANYEKGSVTIVR